MKGVSNQHSTVAVGELGSVTTQAKPRRLCQFPNPKAQVMIETSPDFHDPRGIDTVRTEMTWKQAPNSHGFARPPPLPSAKEVLLTMNNASPDTKLRRSDTSPVKGIPGMVTVAQQAEDHLRLSGPGPALREIHASPPRQHDGLPSPLRRSVRAESTVASELSGAPPKDRRMTAAEVFLQGGTQAPSTAPPPLVAQVDSCKGRGGHATRAQTMWMTQAAPGTASYAPPDSRFDGNTRGLGVGLVAQQDKLKAQVASEVKTLVRRSKEAAVVASRTSDGERQLRIEEGRIRSKAMQRAGYTDRLSQYKYTS